MDHLAEAIQVLRWNATGADYRAALTREQSQAVLDELARLDVPCPGTDVTWEEFFADPFQTAHNYLTGPGNTDP
jgi:hypothetical protein